MTRTRIREAVDQLSNDAWAHRDIPGELERASEIRYLAEEQLADDIATTAERSRVGRIYAVYNVDEWAEEIHVQPENLPLQAAFDPFIELLTGEQRVLIRMIFGGRLTLQEAGDLLNITRQSTLKRLRVIYRELKQMLLVAFGPLPEDQEAPPVISWRGDWDSHLTVVEEPAWLDELYVPVERMPVDHLIFAGVPLPLIVREAP